LINRFGPLALPKSSGKKALYFSALRVEMENVSIDCQGIVNDVARAPKAGGFLFVPDRDHPVGEDHDALTRRHIGLFFIEESRQLLDEAGAVEKRPITLAISLAREGFLISGEGKDDAELASISKDHLCEELVRTNGERAQPDDRKGSLGDDRANLAFDPAPSAFVLEALMSRDAEDHG
jgi:hypothetical protein